MPDALGYISASARENGLDLTCARLDWRHPSPRQAAQTVLAADVLYEARNAGDLARALTVLVDRGGEAWIADPGRTHLPDFVRLSTGFSFAHTTVRAAVGDETSGHPSGRANTPPGPASEIQMLRMVPRSPS